MKFRTLKLGPDAVNNLFLKGINHHQQKTLIKNFNQFSKINPIINQTNNYNTWFIIWLLVNYIY